MNYKTHNKVIKLDNKIKFSLKDKYLEEDFKLTFNKVNIIEQKIVDAINNKNLELIINKIKDNKNIDETDVFILKKRFNLNLDNEDIINIFKKQISRFKDIDKVLNKKELDNTIREYLEFDKIKNVNIESQVLNENYIKHQNIIYNDVVLDNSER